MENKAVSIQWKAVTIIFLITKKGSDHDLKTIVRPATHP